MTTPRVDYRHDFIEDLDQISKLIETPNFIRKLAIDKLQTVSRTSLTTQNNLILQNAIKSLRNIHESSIANNYKIIYNQVCVLAASSLEAILKKHFINATNNYKSLELNNKKLDDIKITLRSMIEKELKLGNSIGEIIVQSDNGLKFQDLQSIKHAFKDYLNEEISLSDTAEKCIIFYLEARHIIVHKGGAVDKKFVVATEARNANLKNLKEGDKVQLDSNDWNNLRGAYVELVAEVTKMSV